MCTTAAVRKKMVPLPLYDAPFLACFFGLIRVKPLPAAAAVMMSFRLQGNSPLQAGRRHGERVRAERLRIERERSWRCRFW